MTLRNISLQLRNSMVIRNDDVMMTSYLELIITIGGNFNHWISFERPKDSISLSDLLFDRNLDETRHSIGGIGLDSSENPVLESRIFDHKNKTQNFRLAFVEIY